MKVKSLPFTADEVRALWGYNPHTGNLSYKPKVHQQGVRIDLFGRVVGQKTKCGIVIYTRVNGKKQSFLGHRIAWLHYYGVEAPVNIEHADGDKLNNRIQNLRLEEESPTDVGYEDFAKAFWYDPEAGKLHRTGKSSKYSEYDHEDATGTYDADGYENVHFLGRTYRIHRIAWLLHYKKWPDNIIDHINGNRSDNKISNLRDATHSINAQNIKKAPAHSSTGFLGATLNKRSGKYAAQIVIAGKKTHLGYFATPEEAHQAYLKAKRKYHPGCTI